jgi:BirA family transcriptional regulator, biotin operon repressor / biotin---[acetyl-CoA-carboxylase] ligase
MQPSFHWLDEVVSTSSWAQELLDRGYPEGTAVVARAQTGGRGRMGRTWTSPPGGLYMTLILRPRIGPERLGWIALCGGIAAAEALAGLSGGAVQVKWPNDVLMGGLKVGGLLGEARLEGASPSVLLGVGLNLTTDPDALPPRPIFPASTVGRVTGVAIAAEDAANGLIERFAPWYGRLQEEGPEPLRRRFEELSAHARRLIEVHDGEQLVLGRDAGVSEQGGLLLDVDGQRREILSGQILRILDEPAEEVAADAAGR